MEEQQLQGELLQGNVGGGLPEEAQNDSHGMGRGAGGAGSQNKSMQGFQSSDMQNKSVRGLQGSGAEWDGGGQWGRGGAWGLGNSRPLSELEARCGISFSARCIMDERARFGWLPADVFGGGS